MSYSNKNAQLTMQHGLSKYSIMGFVQYAVMLCGNALAKDIQSASRIGKAAMSCFDKRFNSLAEQVPSLYLAYYGEVAPYFEPLQSCAEMARQAFNAALSRGENRVAFLNAMQHIKILLFAGEKLPTILEKVDFYLKLADQYNNVIGKHILYMFRDTISTLIDRGESTSLENDGANEVMNASPSSAGIHRHRAIQSYWLGYNERCHHYWAKAAPPNATENLGSIVLTFLHGLGSFQLMKRKNTLKLRMIARDAIAVLKTAASHSQWNYCNKVRNSLVGSDSSFLVNVNLTMQIIVGIT